MIFLLTSNYYLRSMKLRTAVFLAIGAEAAVAALGVNNYGWSVEGLQATTRFSGRLSLFIFSFIFLLHPKEKSKLSFYLSDGYFLVFAIAHGIHLMELLMYVSLAGIPLVPYRVAGGFLAYSMIFLMPWFQLRFDNQKITATKFHALGLSYLFYVWLIFFMTYVSRVSGSFPNVGGTHSEHVTLMGWVCVMLVIKLGILFKGNTKLQPNT